MDNQLRPRTSYGEVLLSNGHVAWVDYLLPKEGVNIKYSLLPIYIFCIGKDFWWNQKFKMYDDRIVLMLCEDNKHSFTIKPGI